MAAPFFLSLVPSFISGLGKIIGGDKGRKMQEAGQIVNELSGQYQTAKLPPEQQAALKTAIMEHEQKLKEIALEEYRLEMQDLKEARDVVKTTLRSEDPYVRRARPTFLWLMYLILFVNYLILPVIGKIPVNLPEALYWLFGSAFLGYSAFRSVDKKGAGLSDIGKFINKTIRKG